MLPLRFAILLFIIMRSPVSASGNFGDSEDVLFDKHRVSPSDAVLAQYAGARVLALGESNHGHYKIYSDLMTLLRMVGSDPNLRFIVFERYHDNAAFYEDLSLRPLELVLKERYFRDLAALDASLCSSFAAAPYTIARFFPLIREFNARRPAGRKLLVTAVDGTKSSNDEIVGSPKARAGNCELKDMTVFYGGSFDRERDTARNFAAHALEQARERRKSHCRLSRGTSSERPGILHACPDDGE